MQKSKFACDKILIHGKVLRALLPTSVFPIQVFDSSLQTVWGWHPYSHKIHYRHSTQNFKKLSTWNMVWKRWFHNWWSKNSHKHANTCWNLQAWAIWGLLGIETKTLKNEHTCRTSFTTCNHSSKPLEFENITHKMAARLPVTRQLVPIIIHNLVVQYNTSVMWCETQFSDVYYVGINTRTQSPIVFGESCRPQPRTMPINDSKRGVLVHLA